MQNQKKISHQKDHEILKNPPIIEALLELRWDINQKMDVGGINYRFLPAYFYKVVKEEYPIIEVLPANKIPDDINPYSPRYRFRRSAGGYPLIQIGPGILTINLDKENFISQNKFLEITSNVLNIFFSNFPEIIINYTLIHYIDAFEVGEENLYEFLSSKLNTSVQFNENIFKNSKIKPNPLNIRLENSFSVENPKGIFTCKLRSGKKGNVDAIIMDTIFESKNENVSEKEKIEKWIDEADDLIHSWFYEMIKNYKELW